MSVPKRQHWVPRFYLKEFSIDKNRKEKQVYIFHNKEGEPQVVNIKDIAVKKYLYAPKNDNGKRDFSIEYKLASLERTISRLWPVLANGYIDLSNNAYRKIISLFIATVFLRHPKREIEYHDMQENLISFYDKFPKDVDGCPKIDRVNIMGVDYALDRSDWHRYSNPTKYDNKSNFVNYIQLFSIDLANVLNKRRWSILVSEPERFITSDNPLILFNKDSQRFTNKGFGRNETVLYFPLSPKRVLLIDSLHKQPDSQYYLATEETINQINKLSWMNSFNFMISHKNPDEVLYECFSNELNGDQP